MKQTVAHKKLSALEGVALIIALIAALLALNYVFSLIAPYIGANIASLMFWISGGALAYLMMRRYVASFSYELGADVLRICRKYGRRERVIEDIYLANLIFVGTPEAAERRCPGAKKLRAVHKSEGLRVCAVAYGTSSGMRIAHLQLNEDMRARLVQYMKEK